MIVTNFRTNEPDKFNLSVFYFSAEISHFCLLPINKSAVFYLLAINKSNISSIIKALIALYDALGGDKGMDVLRVVGNLLCQCRLARCQGWLQKRIASLAKTISEEEDGIVPDAETESEQGTESDAGTES